MNQRLYPCISPTKPPFVPPPAQRPSRSLRDGTLRTGQELLTQEADPDWWRKPIPRQQAQVLRDATGFVLRDAIRFYESGRITQEDLRGLRSSLDTVEKTIETLRENETETRGNFNQLLVDLGWKYDTHQASLTGMQHDISSTRNQFDQVLTQCSAINKAISHLSGLREDNTRLCTLVEEMKEELQLLKEEHAAFREKLEVVREPEADQSVVDEEQSIQMETEDSEPAEPDQEAWVTTEYGPFLRSPRTSPITDVSTHELVGGIIKTLNADLDTPTEFTAISEVDMRQNISEAVGGTGFDVEKAPFEEQDTRLAALIKEAEIRYFEKLPKSEVGFIWEFIDGIQDLELCHKVQMALTAFAGGQLASLARPRRGKYKHRILTIAPQTTWYQFAQIAQNADKASP